MQMEGCPQARPHLPDASKITELADRWILSRYNSAVAGITDGLENYKLHDAMNSVYQFFWNDYCDWYLELIKERMYNGSDEVKVQTLSMALYLMEGIMKLMHPIVPFISEEIWQRLAPRKDGESIMVQKWENAERSWIKPEVDKEFELIQNVIVAVRNIRSEMNISPAKKTDLIVVCSDAKLLGLVNTAQPYIKSLARVENFTAAASAQKPKHAASAVVAGIELYLPLEGIIDVEVERTRLSKEIARLEGQVEGINKKLGNADFVAKAPPQVIEKEKAKLDNFRETIQKLRESLEQFKS
jgi:valyl-tRNA synthetase